MWPGAVMGLHRLGGAVWMRAQHGRMCMPPLAVLARPRLGCMRQCHVDLIVLSCLVLSWPCSVCVAGHGARFRSCRFTRS